MNNFNELERRDDDYGTVKVRCAACNQLTGRLYLTPIPVTKIHKWYEYSDHPNTIFMVSECQYCHKTVTITGANSAKVFFYGFVFSFITSLFIGFFMFYIAPEIYKAWYHHSIYFSTWHPSKILTLIILFLSSVFSLYLGLKISIHLFLKLTPVKLSQEQQALFDKKSRLFNLS